MSTLHRAIELAVRAHRDQDDPPGEPYILHPMRVMLSLPDDDHPLRSVAILHDAVERGTITLADLRQAKFSKDVINGVRLMTHDEDTSYADYVIRLKEHKLARAVKIADLKDNADLRYIDLRTGKPKKIRKDEKRPVRFMLSYKFLTDQISANEYRKRMTLFES